jgi:hypothetical protein
MPPPEDWMDIQRREQGITDPAVALPGTRRNPYKYLDAWDAANPDDPDSAAARRLAESLSPPSQIRGIVGGKEYVMPTQGRDVRADEAMKLIAEMRAKRVQDEQLAASKAERDYNLKSRQDTDAIALQKSRLELAREAQKDVRSNEMRRRGQEMQQTRGMLASLTDKVGLTQAPDRRVALAYETGDPAAVASAEAAIRAEEQAKKQAASEMLMRVASMPGIDAKSQGRLTEAGAQAAGVSLPAGIGADITQARRASMPVAEVVKIQPAIEQTIQSYLQNIGRHSDTAIDKAEYDTAGRAARDQGRILEFANKVATETGGSATEIANYIFSEIGRRSSTLPQSSWLMKDVRQAAMPGLREEYAKRFLSGYGSQPNAGAR